MARRLQVMVLQNNSLRYIFDQECHRLNMGLDLQSLFGLHVHHMHSCTHWLSPATPPPPPAFGLIYEGAIGQPRQTTSLCDPSEEFTSKLCAHAGQEEIRLDYQRSANSFQVFLYIKKYSKLQRLLSRPRLATGQLALWLERLISNPKDASSNPLCEPTRRAN